MLMFHTNPVITNVYATSEISYKLDSYHSEQYCFIVSSTIHAIKLNLLIASRCNIYGNECAHTHTFFLCLWYLIWTLVWIRSYIIYLFIYFSDGTYIILNKMNNKQKAK